MHAPLRVLYPWGSSPWCSLRYMKTALLFPSLFFSRPKAFHPTNPLPVTWFPVPSATTVLLPCHRQTSLGSPGVQSLVITLPSQVQSWHQINFFLFCFALFSLSWPCFWQINTSYRLTQLQKQQKGLYPLHLCLPVAPTTALGNGWVLRNCLWKWIELRELAGTLEKIITTRIITYVIDHMHFFLSP